MKRGRGNEHVVLQGRIIKPSADRGLTVLKGVESAIEMETVRYGVPRTSGGDEREVHTNSGVVTIRKGLRGRR